MATLFYEHERNTDFYNTCEQVRKEAAQEGRIISVAEITSKAVYRKAKLFYIHKKVIIQILKNKGEILPKNEMSKLLHLEILSRGEALRAEAAQESATPKPLRHIAEIISDQEAPRFYMSEARAQSLYYELIRKGGVSW